MVAQVLSGRLKKVMGPLSNRISTKFLQEEGKFLDKVLIVNQITV